MPDPVADHVADALKEILACLDAREAAGAGPFSPQPDLFLRYVGIHAASRPGADVAGTLRRIKRVIGDGTTDPSCRLDIVRSLCRVELQSRRRS
jgi:hypothetical protein